MYVCMYAYACMYVCMYVRMYVGMHVYIKISRYRGHASMHFETILNTLKRFKALTKKKQK